MALFTEDILDNLGGRDLIMACRSSPDQYRICTDYLPRRIRRDFGVGVTPEESYEMYAYLNNPSVYRYVEARISGDNEVANYFASTFSPRQRIEADAVFARECIPTAYTGKCMNYLEGEYLIKPVDPNKTIEWLAKFVYLGNAAGNIYLGNAAGNQTWFRELYKQAAKDAGQTANITFSGWLYDMVALGNWKIQEYIAEIYSPKVDAEFRYGLMLIYAERPELIRFYLKKRRIFRSWLPELRDQASAEGYPEFAQEINRIINNPLPGELDQEEPY